ncbi:MAG: hypothetical protein IPP83_00360 [Flavobacteriales bacterium]|nr:hypothetical protein [Flavobacteriales bacterium]
MLRSLSLFVVCGLCALLLILRTTQPTKHALTWDVFGYYLYLPATFIHDDPGLKDHAWLDEVMATYDPSTTLYQLVDGTDGSRVIKYSSGMAVAYAPWFLLAHVLAEPLGYPADGFSPPYQVLVTYGTLLYVLIGLFLLRKVLLHFFDDRLVAALLVLVVLGTNFLHLAALDGTLLTHPLLFTLYAGLVLATIRWHAKPSWKSALAIGALVGWVTLIRPSELVCVLIPLLWIGADGLRGKWVAIKEHPAHLLIAFPAFVVAALPQPLYWHAVTGEWLFYSYVNAGEGFDFAAPHVVDYLFSFRKGWFVYTPLMVMAMLGMMILWKRARHLFWVIGIFLVLDLYIVSSWTNWWYAGGSFSARSMVPAYALLAIPLGYLIRQTTAGRVWRAIACVALPLLVVLNLFQTWQWNHGIISKERMTAGYYAAIFGRTCVPPDAQRLLLVDRPLTEEEVLMDTRDYSMRVLYENTFDDRADSVYTLTAEDPFTPGPDLRFDELTSKDHAWLRISAKLFITDSTDASPVIVCTFHHKGETYKYKTMSWELTNAPKNAWLNTSFDYISPEVRSPEDNVKVYIWNQHGGTHRVDGLRVEAWEPK